MKQDGKREAIMIMNRINRNCKWFGFNLKPNHYVGIDGTTLVATSGWSCNDCLFVYRYDADVNEWKGDWENIDQIRLINKMKFKGGLNKVRKTKRNIK